MRDFVGGSDYNPLVGSIKGIWRAMANGFTIDSGIGEIDQLLSRGGMDSMLLTLWLIVGAVTFGALLEEFGLIARLVDPLIRSATSTGRLYVTVFACGFGLNVVAGVPHRVRQTGAGGHQPVPPGRRQRHRHLAAGALELLRRVHGRRAGRLDAAVPALLRVHIASPLLSVLYGITGFRIERVEPAEQQ
jgi:Na+:H+ antiporter, NhaC family